MNATNGAKKTSHRPARAKLFGGYFSFSVGTDHRASKVGDLGAMPRYLLKLEVTHKAVSTGAGNDVGETPVDLEVDLQAASFDELRRGICSRLNLASNQSVQIFTYDTFDRKWIEADSTTNIQTRTGLRVNVCSGDAQVLHPPRRRSRLLVSKSWNTLSLDLVIAMVFV